MTARRGAPSGARDSPLLGGEGELNEGLNRTLKALFDIFRQAEYGFILTEEADGQLNPRAIRRRDGETNPPGLSRTVLEHVMNAGEALLIADVQSEPAFRSANTSPDQESERPCGPLPGRAGRPIGILQLDSRSRRPRFGPSDLDLLAAAAIPIGMAIENYRLFKARARRRPRARSSSLCSPGIGPKSPGIPSREHYEPALEVGGNIMIIFR